MRKLGQGLPQLVVQICRVMGPPDAISAGRGSCGAGFSFGLLHQVLPRLGLGAVYLWLFDGDVGLGEAVPVPHWIGFLFTGQLLLGIALFLDGQFGGIVEGPVRLFSLAFGPALAELAVRRIPHQTGIGTEISGRWAATMHELRLVLQERTGGLLERTGRLLERTDSLEGGRRSIVGAFGFKVEEGASFSGCLGLAPGLTALGTCLLEGRKVLDVVVLVIPGLFPQKFVLEGLEVHGLCSASPEGLIVLQSPLVLVWIGFPGLFLPRCRIVVALTGQMADKIVDIVFAPLILLRIFPGDGRYVLLWSCVAILELRLCDLRWLFGFHHLELLARSLLPLGFGRWDRHGGRGTEIGESGVGLGEGVVGAEGEEVVDFDVHVI